jgi:hypothetical protein
MHTDAHTQRYDAYQNTAVFIEWSGRVKDVHPGGKEFGEGVLQVVDDKIQHALQELVHMPSIFFRVLPTKRRRRGEIKERSQDRHTRTPGMETSNIGKQGEEPGERHREQPPRRAPRLKHVLSRQHVFYEIGYHFTGYHHTGRHMTHVVGENTADQDVGTVQCFRDAAICREREREREREKEMLEPRAATWEHKTQSSTRSRVASPHSNGQYTHGEIHTHGSTLVWMYTQTRTWRDTHKHTWKHTRMDVHTNTHMERYTHTHKHTHMDVHSYMDAHTWMYTKDTHPWQHHTHCKTRTHRTTRYQPSRACRICQCCCFTCALRSSTSFLSAALSLIVPLTFVFTLCWWWCGETVDEKLWSPIDDRRRNTSKLSLSHSLSLLHSELAGLERKLSRSLSLSVSLSLPLPDSDSTVSMRGDAPEAGCERCSRGFFRDGVLG